MVDHHLDMKHGKAVKAFAIEKVSNSPVLQVMNARDYADTSLTFVDPVEGT